MDRVQLKRSGAGGACQEIAPTETHPHLEPWESADLGIHTGGRRMGHNIFYDRAWNYNLLFMTAM